MNTGMVTNPTIAHRMNTAMLVFLIVRYSKEATWRKKAEIQLTNLIFVIYKKLFHLYMYQLPDAFLTKQKKPKKNKTLFRIFWSFFRAYAFQEKQD